MFIEFSFNVKLLFLLVFPISRELEKLVKEKILKDESKFFHIFRIFLSDELAFIFMIIFACMNKSQKNEDISNDNENIVDNKAIDVIDNELKKAAKKKSIKSVLMLIFLSIVFVGSYTFNYCIGHKNVKLSRNTIGIIYEIIIFYILSIFILKEKYHKHHLISLAIIFVLLIGLFIRYFEDLNNSKYSIYNAFWYYLVYYSLYGIFYVFLKKYILIYFHSVYYIIFIIGAIVCIPILIYDVITYHVKPEISGIISGFIENINSVENIFWFLLETIFQFFSNLGIFWIVYYFTPFHFIISEFICEILNYYIKYFQSDPNQNNKYGFIYENTNIAIFSSVFFINLICSLIFNEIIILKFCKLEYYTKKYIDIRAKDDAYNLFKDDDSNISEKENSKDNDEQITTNEEPNINNEEHTGINEEQSINSEEQITINEEEHIINNEGQTAINED